MEKRMVKRKKKMEDEKMDGEEGGCRRGLDRWRMK